MSDTQPDPTGSQQRSAISFDQAYVNELRQESAGYRIRAKEAEAKAAENANAAAELAALKAEIKAGKIGSALTETATKLGISNPRLLRAALNDAGTLPNDPNGADFLPALEAAIQTALEANPELKGQPINAAVRSGSDGMSTNRAPSVEVRQPITRADLADMKPEEIASRYAKGELNALLGRTR
jgi:hypothetical protein